MTSLPTRGWSAINSALIVDTRALRARGWTVPMTLGAGPVAKTGGSDDGMDCAFAIGPKRQSVTTQRVLSSTQ